MKLTCTQMDVLISFYIDGELSSSLKTQVEDHIKSCASCRAKYDIIKSMLVELKNNFNIKDDKEQNKELEGKTSTTTSQQYRLFQENLSAYIDNELNNEENLKVKKFAINNNKARKELETNYNIRKLMIDSFKKTKSEAKYDFSKNVLRQLELEEASSGLHPVIILIIYFVIIVLVLTALVLMYLSV